ncbi:tyrosine-protein kinase family protein [Iningainema tapete]|uniref:ParA family protein n=1 Tax=Iningainema tapete BLCC-T55 TaxID=2748662 RepID=A0A8J7BYS0_9CYAN|nr:ParA family protein [Iningainema tapete]MBD2776252.1 ParA family protein [Iningainema tapete BLCC-T55]
MTYSSTITTQDIQKYLNENLSFEDKQVQVSVKRTSLGWLKIRIITSCFEDKQLIEREEKIDNLLKSLNSELNLGQYPIAGYDLLTPNEALDIPPQYIQLPLWSDILMAPEPDEPLNLDEDSPKKPLVVTFYSFKGGVGRSTALGLVAGILATRNRRVVMVDFDLEAPGISILFQPDMENSSEQRYGVVDYLHQRNLTPEQDIPNIADCIYQINLQTRGELFLVPVGEYDENYIHRLADLDMRSFYKSGHNAVEQLMEDIKAQLDPDVILIDARPGFNDVAAIALFDLADTAIICFSPTEQSFEGLRWVVQTVRKQKEYQGKPDIRFLLTPVPPVAAEQHKIWIDKVENWIENNWGLPNGTTVGELYYEILYNPNITTLSSLTNDVPKSLLDAYLPLADTIDASLPDIKPSVTTKIIANRKTILNELRFEAATAQELEPVNIPNIFQRTEDFPKFLSNRTWLIRGAKGTGKSLLFRLFVEQPDAAKELAQTDVNLNNVNFIAGHGQPRVSVTILESGDIASYEQQVGEDDWHFFWLNYSLLQLCKAKSELSLLSGLDEKLIALSSQENPSHGEIVSWLVERSQSPIKRPQAVDELRAINLWLQQNNQVVWLFYDELDAGFGSSQRDYERRRRALEALLAWWLESGTSLKQIVPKIFLREDIWNQLNFTNTGHYSGRSLQLRWEEADLWRLVLRQALKSSELLRKSLEQKLGVTVERLNIIGLEQLRQSLYPLWGERMGRTKKAYTYNWVRNRIADGQNNCFPRSLILLLEEAVKLEKDFSTEYSAEITLRPKALIDAFPYVSQQRVAEVRNEYPELENFLNRLQGERSPIDENRLAEIRQVEDGELALRIKDMVEAGIFTERSRPKDPPPRVYGVAELYLYGLGMVRKGQR